MDSTSDCPILLGLADCAHREMVNAITHDKNQLVLNALDRVGYRYMSERDKLFVLTYGKYDFIRLSLHEVYDTNRPESNPDPALQPASNPAIPTFNPTQPAFNQAASVFNQRDSAFNFAGPTFNQGVPEFNQAAQVFNQKGPTFNPGGPTFNQGVPTFNQAAPDFNQRGPAFNPAGSTFNQAFPDFNQGCSSLHPSHQSINFSRAAPVVNQERTAFHQGGPTFNQTVPVFSPAAPVLNPTASTLNPSAPAFKPAAPALNPATPALNPAAPIFNPAAKASNHTAPLGSQGALFNPPQLGPNMAVQMASFTSDTGNLQLQGLPVQHLRVQHAINPGQMPRIHLQEPHADKFDKSSMYPKNPLWAHIISSDNVHFMEAILKQIPLHAIHKANIPPEVTWIESPAWMQDSLRNNNARWNGQVCDYNHGAEEVDYRAKLELMKQIALTMHATELFSQCCKYRATKCMQYLLEKAPNLIRMKASSTKNRLALDIALLYDSAITNVLLERGAKVSGQESVRVLAEIYKNRKANIVEATEIICKENKELVRDFVQCPGDNLLHILYQNICHKRKTLKLKDVVTCTKHLLSTGLDPTIKALSSEETVLDILLSALKMYTLTGPNHRDLKQYVEIIIACREMILPTFKGKPAGNVDLLPSIGGQNMTQTTVLVLIEQLQMILESDVNLANNDVTLKYVNLLFTWTNAHHCRFCD